jgi:hypothetical protein
MSLAGHRRVVPLAGGMCTGRELNGNLLPGGSAGWQIVPPDGTALGKIRYSLRTDSGALLYVQAVLARATPRWPRGCGEVRTPTPASTFRAATHIETAAPCLDWLNKGVFTILEGRKAASMMYETDLVG